jgi:hypothetical protein
MDEVQYKNLLIKLAKKVSYELLLESKKMAYLDIFVEWGLEPPYTSQEIATQVEQAQTFFRVAARTEDVIVALKNLKNTLNRLRNDIHEWEIKEDITFEQEYARASIRNMSRNPENASPQPDRLFTDDHSGFIGGKRGKKTRRRKKSKKKTRRVRRNVNKK